MVNQNRVGVFPSGLLVATFLLAGCGSADQSSQEPTVTADSYTEPPTDVTADNPQASPTPDFSPVVLGGENVTTAGAGPTDGLESTSQRRQEVLSAMMPLQVMLGGWRGITRRQVGDFKGVSEPQWVWDFQTDRSQPAMVMTAADDPYFREMRLTYLTDRDTFQMTSRGPDGETRTFEGQFSEQPAEVPGDNNRPQVTYKLTLTQRESDATDDRLQVVFNQQENNHYLLELYQQRGGDFRRIDTVSTTREGASIAANDEDYGERKCVISGGLGTMQVSYNGRTFWVCCTGCKAAFEDDPETWIAEYDAAAK